MADGSQTWFNYVPLSGVGPKIADDGSRVFCSIPISREAEGLPPLELAIIGDATKLDLVRVAIPIRMETLHKTKSTRSETFSTMRFPYFV
jgi:hypothetical protein